MTTSDLVDDAKVEKIRNKIKKCEESLNWDIAELASKELPQLYLPVLLFIFMQFLHVWVIDPELLKHYSLTSPKKTS